MEKETPIIKRSTLLNPQGLEHDSLCLRTSFFVARLQDVQNIRCVAQQALWKHIDNAERYPTIFILISINGDKWGFIPNSCC